METHDNILQEATDEQLQLAAAFNHTELFCINAISVGGEIHRSPGVVWTNAGSSLDSMIAFPTLPDDRVAGQLDEIVEYYLKHPPAGVGCWSLDPPQPKDLGVRLLARGFQPGCVLNGWHLTLKL